MHPIACQLCRRKQTSVWAGRHVGFVPRSRHRQPVSAGWSCVSSIGVASARRSKFAVKPTGPFRPKGIGRNNADLNLIALGAFEQPVFETYWPR
jgi:hypothetical protein